MKSVLNKLDIVDSKLSFFVIHLVVGFLTIWLCYAEIKHLFSMEIARSLMVESLVETGFLVITVIWGNLGWDSFRRLKPGVTGSNLPAELSKSTAPIAITMVVVLVLLDFNQETARLSWLERSLCIAAIIIVSFFYWRYQEDLWKAPQGQAPTDPSNIGDA